MRFIDAFVEGLDLTAAGFLRVKTMGRPGYAPGDLLKLYIYGYLNRVRSRACGLETECHRNIPGVRQLATKESADAAPTPCGLMGRISRSVTRADIAAQFGKIAKQKRAPSPRTGSVPRCQALPAL